MLVDRVRFPAPTLSTHFFRGAGLLSVLGRLTLLDRVLALGAPPLVCQYIYANGSSHASSEPPQAPGEVGYCLSVRRITLDHLLLQRACAAPTVDVAEDTRVTGLLWDAGRVVGVRLATAQASYTTRARLVIGADGRHSLVARAVNAPLEAADPALRAMYYCYMRDFRQLAGRWGAEFSRRGDEVAYVFPSDDGVTCVALSINAADFAWMRQAPCERFRTRLALHTGLAERFASATPISAVMGCGPERNYVRVPIGPGWALVGDAGMHQDPWSGQGMDMAGTHAVFLADAVLRWLGHDLPEQAAMETYHRLRNEHGLRSYQRTVALGRDLRQLMAAH